MAYVIEYDGQVGARFLQQEKRGVNLKRVLIFSLVVLVAVVWTITPVRVAVLDFVLPGDGAVTRRAAGTMFREIKDGQPFREAFSDFCIEIFENP